MKKTCKDCKKLFETRKNSPRCKECVQIRTENKKMKQSTTKAFQSKERAKLKDKLDKLWSEVVRMQGYCSYCGKKEHLNAHHIFSRANTNTRWEVNNGICLCSGCHTFSSRFSAHLTPVEFTLFLEETKGRDFIDYLRNLASKPIDDTLEFRGSKMKELQAIKQNTKNSEKILDKE